MSDVGANIGTGYREPFKAPFVLPEPFRTLSGGVPSLDKPGSNTFPDFSNPVKLITDNLTGDVDWNKILLWLGIGVLGIIALSVFLHRK